MSILTRLILVTLLFFAPALQAADVKDQIAGEIIYRVNLGRADDIKLLLEQGASADQTNEDGVPLIALAAARKDDEGGKVLEALLAAKANINAQDAQGKTALFYAAKVGNAAAIKVLLDNKINYYAVDNRGDIARTVAFRAGNNKIVEMMDEFVRAETNKVNQQYADAKDEIAKRYEEQNKQAEERNRQIKEAQDKAYEQQLKQMQDVKQQMEKAAQLAQEAQQKAAQEKQKAEEERQKAEEAKKAAALPDQAPTDVRAVAPALDAPAVDSQPAVEESKITQSAPRDPAKELSRRAQRLAFHSCSLQYWFYVRESQLPTELTPNELDEAIESEKDIVLDNTAQVSAMNPKPADFPQKLSERVKGLIYRQIDRIPTRRLRREAGVGTVKDMRKRCETISQQWQIVPADMSDREKATDNGDDMGDDPMDKKSKENKDSARPRSQK